MIAIKDLILILESTPGYCQTLRSFLQITGLEVHCIKSMEEVLSAFTKRDYCLSIFELQQLSRESIKIICEMREVKPVPIVAITEAISVEQKIELFQAGVHAYIEKPINPEVCIAQAVALMQLGGIGTVNTQQGELAFGTELIIKPRYRQVFVHGELLELTRKEYDLLCYLAQSPCQVFNYEQLYSHVWKDDYIFGGENTVKVHIVTLRKKMSGIKKDCIQNEWGIGYKFVPPDCTV